MPVRAKPIVPKELLADTKRLHAALANSLKQVSLAGKADFGVTTQTWKHQPEFKIEIVDLSKARVYTVDQIYTWVNDGTDPIPFPAALAPSEKVLIMPRSVSIASNHSCVRSTSSTAAATAAFVL